MTKRNIHWHIGIHEKSGPCGPDSLRQHTMLVGVVHHGSSVRARMGSISGSRAGTK